eukprot:6310234-Amphidinium_carterae.1
MELGGLKTASCPSWTKPFKACFSQVIGNSLEGSGLGGEGAPPKFKDASFLFSCDFYQYHLEKSHGTHTGGLCVNATQKLLAVSGFWALSSNVKTDSMHLSLRWNTYQSLTVLGKGHNRWGGPSTLAVFNHLSTDSLALWHVPTHPQVLHTHTCFTMPTRIITY